MDTQSLATILGAQLEAIDRSQGRIEFTPDGVIIDVNKNYLEAMGYHRDEVLGRHHRCFVEPTYRESQAYARFWEKLRSGEHHCDEFVRIAKDGSRRWIQANYNPILDEAGRVWKVVKYAVDITRQKQAEQIAERAAVALDAQLAAIDRSQGRIEFNPDGVIIDVNDNYLRMMGYSRHEVIGRQHRMFVPGEILDDEGYLAFWASLQ
ncbi:Biofilm dispersion protein BdlA [Botrimarina colliarenosi]|uniref:Biofilm dispersion protein BdlA n=1 Tax=Botrimarina colliarenosi TaxID=2528001 RepID=A0A5C6AJW6_9BACT|nr:PAS domain-containing protein [Botrimarina colliarenosi]TWT99797.1 Biofilm dispersion protein BdlA [Botrimarina colliarenosi]